MGQGLRLEAISIFLTGSNASKYDVYYRVHDQNFGDLGWAKNGAYAGTPGPPTNTRPFYDRNQALAKISH